MKQKVHRLLFLILILFFRYDQAISADLAKPLTNTNDSYVQKTIKDKSNWKTFKSNYGWNIKYPKDWNLGGIGDISVNEAEMVHLNGPNDCYHNNVPCAHIEINSMHMPGACCYKSASILKKSTKELVQWTIKAQILSKVYKKVDVVTEGSSNYGGWDGYYAVYFTTDTIGSSNWKPTYNRIIKLRSDNKMLLIGIYESAEKIYEKLEEVKYIKLYEEILSTLQFQKSSTEKR